MNMFGLGKCLSNNVKSIKTSSSGNEAMEKRSSSEGFVLPYVLVAIAIMSLVITIAAQRLQNISELILQIQNDTEAEMAFMSAEAEILYIYLTSIPAQGGMQLITRGEEQERRKRTPVAPLNSSRDQDLAWRNVWSGAGETRRVQTPYGDVMASYRDISGLIDINSAKENILEKFIISFDVRPSLAKALAATLVDYRDPNHQRKFRGAEAVDYRLRKLPPPTNSPLKSYNELNAILYWPEFLDAVDMHKFMDTTTLAGDVGYLRYAFVAPEMLEALGLHTQKLQADFGSDGFLSYLVNEKFPSDRARFTLKIRTNSTGYRKRVVEFKRELSGLNKPFERFWIYDATVLEGADDSVFAHSNGLKNVFQSTPDSSQ